MSLYPGWITPAVKWLTKQRPEVVLLFLLFGAACFGLYHLPERQEAALMRLEDRHDASLDRVIRSFEADQVRDAELRRLLLDRALGAGPPLIDAAPVTLLQP